MLRIVCVICGVCYLLVVVLRLWFGGCCVMCVSFCALIVVCLLCAVFVYCVVCCLLYAVCCMLSVLIVCRWFAASCLLRVV